MTLYHWLAILFVWFGLICIIGIQYRNMKRLDAERERWLKAYEEFLKQEKDSKDPPPSGGNRRADRG